MFWTLLKIKMRSLFHGNKQKKPTKAGVKVLIGLLIAYVLVIFIGMFAGMFYMAAEMLSGTGSEWLYFALVAVVMFMLGVITTVYAAQTQVFEAKDNELLLSMPIKPSLIIASRLGAIMSTDLIEDLLIGILAFVIFAMKCEITVLGGIIYFVELLFLVLITTAVSVLVGWLLALITSRVKNKAAITTAISLIFFAAYFYFISKIEDIFTVIEVNIGNIEGFITDYLYPLVWFGKAITEQNIMPFVIFAAVCIVPFMLEVWIISKTFNKIATSKAKFKYKEYKADNTKARSAASSFSSKEIKRFTSSAAYMVNAGFGLILMVILAVYIVIQKDTVNELLAEIPQFSGIIGVVLIFAISLINTMNQVSAPSISLEGKNLWLIKSLPIRPRDVMMGKIYAHIKICAPFSIITSLAANYAFSLSIFMRIAVIIVPLAAVVFTAFIGLVTNLVFPKLEWNDEAAAVKQSMSVLLSMGICFAVFITSGVLCFIIGIIPGLEIIASVIMLVILMVPVICMYRYICNNGTKRFNNL